MTLSYSTVQFENQVKGRQLGRGCYRNGVPILNGGEMRLAGAWRGWAGSLVSLGMWRVMEK